MRARAIFLSVLFLAGCATITGFVVHSSAASADEALVCTVAPKYDATAWIHGGERFPQGAAIVIREGGKVRKLAPDFAASADPNISFDGKSVLFAGKKAAGDPWQIWEVDLDDGTVRRIVNAKEDVVRPMYLPEGRVVFAHKRGGNLVIEAAAMSGEKPLGLFYAPGSAMPTDVLRDGRILFEATYPLGYGETPETYTVYSDGSGVESYRCDHGKPRYSARETASGDIVFTRGRGLARFTSPLAHDIEISAPVGEYAGDVVELADGEWLLSYRADAKSPFALKRWKPGAATLTSVANEANASLVQAVPVAARTVPNRHPSGLHPWTYANLLTLNAYTSKSKFPAGSIAQVRLYSQDAAGKPLALGSAPVEKDGSFFVQVPGDRPLQFELLDSSGRTLKKEAGWWYARAGEQRICVGCHAGPERAPDNAVPAVLLRSTEPADLTGTKGPNRTSETGGN